MDLSTIEGLELSADQAAAILALHDEDVKGLKKNNADLLEEKRIAMEKEAAAKAAAEQAEQEAELERARKANDLASLEETLKKQSQEKLDAAISSTEALKQSITDSKRDAILADMSGEFISPEAAKLVLKNMINVNLADDLSTTVEFNGFDGSTVATDSKTFLEWAGKNDSLASLMKPIDSAGGDSSGSKNVTRGDVLPKGDLKDMSPADRVKVLKSKHNLS